MESLKINPSQSTVKTRLAQLYNLMGNYNEAEDIILPLTIEYPANVDNLYVLAISYMGNKRHKMAFETIKKIEKLDKYAWGSIDFSLSSSTYIHSCGATSRARVFACYRIQQAKRC